jgi:hypothetical protein
MRNFTTDATKRRRDATVDKIIEYEAMSHHTSL